MSTRVSPAVVHLTESALGKTKMAVGKVLKHPDGRKVKIVDGEYWGTYGISNHWSWREVLSAPGQKERLGLVEHGYGWC